VSRLRPGDVVAGAGGVVLLVSLFLHWYGLDAHALTAWRAFSVTDVLLAAGALLGVAVPVVTAIAGGPAKPMASDVLAVLGGALAVLVILFRLIDQPGDNRLVTVEAGAWVGLAGALIQLAGAWWAMSDERTPGAVPPTVPRRPAPTGLEPRPPAVGP
jgi:uncharacterized membrane protein